MKYRKKPIVIEAMQWTGLNIDEMQTFFANTLDVEDVEGWRGVPIEIETLEGCMRAEVGDWIIKGVKGEFYPCKPDIFAATYELAELEEEEQE